MSVDLTEGKFFIGEQCYVADSYTTAYDERGATVATTRPLNDVAAALSFYAGPTQVPFEGFLVELTNTSAAPVDVTATVEDLDSGTQTNSTLTIASGTAEYFFPFSGLMVGDNAQEGYDLLWSGANLGDVTMNFLAPRDQSVGQIFSLDASFNAMLAWVTATAASAEVIVQTYEDEATGELAYVQVDENGGRTDLASIPASWTPCPEDTGDTDRWLVGEACYDVDIPASGPFDQTISFSTLAEPTSATIGVATHNQSGGWTIPAIEDLKAQMGGNAQWRLSRMVVATAANNQGNGSVVNVTQGVSSNSVLINPSDTNTFAFQAFQPQATDVWRWGGIVANTRNVDMQAGDTGTDNVGRTDGPRLSFDLVYRTGVLGKFTVQTYEDLDGNLTYVQTDEAGVRTDLTGFDPDNLPAGWSLCAEKEAVSDTCYLEDGAALPVLDNDAFLDEISPPQLATLPAGAHMRWTATSDVALDVLELNGFTNGTATISWLASNGQSGSGSVTFNATNPYPLALGGVELAAGETIDFTLVSLTAGQMQLTTAATSIANGWTALQDYSAFANTSHWATRLFTSEIGENRIVRSYTDGTLAVVDKDASTVTALTDIPATWTKLPHVDCEDHTPITDRITALEKTGGTGQPVLSEIYTSFLASGNQDTNDAARTYLWQSALSGPDFEYNAANGRFEAQRRLTANISFKLRVSNASANDRAAFVGEIAHFSSTGVLLGLTSFTSTYIRDDIAFYDKGQVGGADSITFDPDDYFVIRSERLSSQDPGDDNPADQTLSNLRIRVWGVE